MSPGYVRIAVWPAAALSIVLSIALTTIPAIRQSLDGESGFIRTYFIFTPVAAAFMGMAIMWPVADLLNVAVGENFRDAYTVSRTVYERRSRSIAACQRVQLRELDDYWFGRLCVSEEAFRMLKPGDPLGLAGTRSWIGVQPKRYSY